MSVVLPVPLGPTRPNPLAGAQLERHPVEDRLGAVVLLNAFNLKEDHRAAEVYTSAMLACSLRAAIDLASRSPRACGGTWQIPW